MCEPVSIALTVASIGFSVYQAQEQAKAQQKIADVQAQNQRIQGEDAKSRGLVAEEAHRAKVKQLVGQQTAMQGASGAEVGSGSFGDMLTQTTTMGELDSLRVRDNAFRQAWGMESAAQQSEYEGRVAKAQGNVKTAGVILQGASKAYGQYKGLK